jgi:hypothetical protein
MTNVEIEKRIRTLEAEVDSLKRKIETNGSDESPWYKQIPKFGGNRAYEEAARLGRKYRRSQKAAMDE